MNIEKKSVLCYAETSRICYYSEFLAVGLQRIVPLNKVHCYAPAIYNGGGHIASPLSVRRYVHTYVRTYVRPVRTKNGFRAISFENIGVLDSYFIHRYIIIKYRSSSIMDKIH